MSAMGDFDDVKPFPSLLPPAKRRDPPKNKGRGKTRKPVVGTESTVLPGLLKSTKRDLTQGLPLNSAHLVGFNASHIRMDGTSPRPYTYTSSSNNDVVASLKQVNLNTQSSPSKQEKKPDPAIAELRTYTSLMDQYSLHNFMIWNGRALRSTPEFQSFQRTYANEWSYILSVIAQLEKLMTENSIKLAIISGVKVAEYAALNLPSLQHYQILDCVANADQIRSEISDFEGGEHQHVIAATVKIQTIARRWHAMYRYRDMKRKLGASVLLQSIVRLFITRCRACSLLKQLQAKVEASWTASAKHMEDVLHSSFSVGQKKLLIYIPSVSTPEFYRTQLSNFSAIQNSNISCLCQLMDPDLEMVYVSPRAFGPTERSYLEKFLNLMNISILPSRLKIIVPELSGRLPESVSLAQSLWYSSSSLNKLRAILGHHNIAYIISASAGWAEKRISYYLKYVQLIAFVYIYFMTMACRTPLLSPEPVLSQELSSRSQSKRLFMEASMSIPIGAHDVHSEDDLLIALTRLMSSNLDVNRWLIRLNTDFNNEGTAYIDANKLPIMSELKKEQRALMHTNADAEAWFERHVQLNARKRILHAIQETDMGAIKICRPDIYPDYRSYIEFVRLYGAVVEAEPPSIRGHVESYCLMYPNGDTEVIRGAVVLADENYQRQGISFPQTLVHDKALEGATKAVASNLIRKHKCVGFVTITFCVFWDGFEEMSRLWASNIAFGMHAAFGALGTLACLTRPSDEMETPKSMIVDIPTGRCCIHVPSLLHLPLMSSRDDVFFRMCKMNGIAFDYDRKTGIVFYLADSIIGGMLSFMAVAETRIKSIELSIHALTFILQNFGKHDESDLTNSWCQMKNVLKSLKSALKAEVGRARLQIK